MPTQRPFQGEYRAPNGIFYKVTGHGEPLLLLHGLMVTGAMFDPLVVLLQNNFRMIIPDLRGHGQSGDLSGPYDVPSLTADLDGVLEHAGFENCAVLGYSHGGAVAQQRRGAALIGHVRFLPFCPPRKATFAGKEKPHSAPFRVRLSIAGMICIAPAGPMP
jgi:pimeloyl-ACP methyl ester carboxylesterase